MTARIPQIDAPAGAFMHADYGSSFADRSKLWATGGKSGPRAQAPCQGPVVRNETAEPYKRNG